MRNDIFHVIICHFEPALDHTAKISLVILSLIVGLHQRFTIRIRFDIHR